MSFFASLAGKLIGAIAGFFLSVGVVSTPVLTTQLGQATSTHIATTSDTATYISNVLNASSSSATSTEKRAATSTATVFSNAEYGFSFDHPFSWQFEEATSTINQNYYNDPYLEVTFSDQGKQAFDMRAMITPTTTNDLTPEYMLKSGLGPAYESYRTVAGVPSVLRYCSGRIPNSCLEVAFEKGAYIYDMDFLNYSSSTVSGVLDSFAATPPGQFATKTAPVIKPSNAGQTNTNPSCVSNVTDAPTPLIPTFDPSDIKQLVANSDDVFTAAVDRRLSDIKIGSMCYPVFDILSVSPIKGKAYAGVVIQEDVGQNGDALLQIGTTYIFSTKAIPGTGEYVISFPPYDRVQVTGPVSSNSQVGAFWTAAKELGQEYVPIFR